VLHRGFAVAQIARIEPPARVSSPFRAAPLTRLTTPTRRFTRALAIAPLLASAAIALAAGPAKAQQAGVIAGGVAWEARAESRWAGAPDGQLMLGGAVPLERSVRLAALAGAGVERSARGSDPSVVGELHARVLLDPLGSRSFGWYGVVGLGFRAAENHSPRAYLLALGGVEGPRLLAGRVRLALEAGVGDGVRLGVVLRAARPGAR